MEEATRALITFWAAIGSVVLLAVYTGTTLWLAFLTRNAIEEARKNNEQTTESNRIARLGRQSSLILTEVSGSTLDRADIKIQNTGGMPAKGITVIVKGWLCVDNVEEGRQPIPASCFLNQTLSNGGEPAASSIFLDDLPSTPEAIHRMKTRRDSLRIDVRILYFDEIQTIGVLVFTCAWVCKNPAIPSGGWIRFTETSLSL